VISDPARSKAESGSIEGPAEKLYTRWSLIWENPFQISKIAPLPTGENTAGQSYIIIKERGCVNALWGKKVEKSGMNGGKILL
jgi:hypothetical protein